VGATGSPPRGDAGANDVIARVEAGSGGDQLPAEGDTQPGSAGTDPVADGVMDLDLEELRFSKIQAGTGKWCGLTTPDADLVCVSDGKADLILEGPLLDFGLSNDLAEFHFWCAITEEGRPVCNGVEQAYPGKARYVSVGFFNACATGEGGTECFIGEGSGGLGKPPELTGPISVEMWALCVQIDITHASCVDVAGNELLPTDAHYLAATAIPKGGCVAVMGEPDAPPLPAGTDDETRELFGSSQVTCVSDNQQQVVANGLFSALDADINGDGCAYHGKDDAVVCWGRHAGVIPSNLDAIKKLSVSASQVCVLFEEGTVECFGASSG